MLPTFLYEYFNIETDKSMKRQGIAAFPRAFRGVYPFRPDSLHALLTFGKDKQFFSPQEVIMVLTPMIEDIEGKLNNANV